MENFRIGKRAEIYNEDENYDMDHICVDSAALSRIEMQKSNKEYIYNKY